MRIPRLYIAVLCISLPAVVPSFASPLVTGNGFGFAVVSQDSGMVTKFYAHPYSDVGQDPRNPLAEGIETTNFVKALGWSGADAHDTAVEYVDDSHVIHIHRGAGDGMIFMPFGLSQTALIINWEPAVGEAAQGTLQVEWNHAVQSQRSLRRLGTEIQLLHFEGVPGSLLLIPLGATRASTDSSGPLASSRSWALIAVENDEAVEQAASAFIQWRAGLEPARLVKRELAQLEHWRVRPAVHFSSEKERHLWRQSEVMLRIAQSREPNRPGRYGNGLIVASLPDGLWFTPWVRDMSWATVAFARMGHRAEARVALLAYFNARPTGMMREQTGGADYQISVVRYFGDGAEEPFFTMEGQTNIEFDDWGEVLWALGEYLKRYDDPGLLKTPTYRGVLYESARDYVVKPLMANTEKYADGLIVAADTSIWEEHQIDKKHFAFSTAMAIVGLKDFAEIAHRPGDEAARSDALHHVDLLQKGFNAAFVRNGSLHGTLEEGMKNDIDGALLGIINFGVVTDPAIVRDTVDRMELLKVASGGYRRVRSNYTDPAIFEYWYERQEFLFVDFSLAEIDRRLGRTTEATAMLERIVDGAAADHDVIPEMYVAVPCSLFPGKIGDPTGALPMVGYGAGEYILHVLEREKLDHGR